ncbi:cellulase family glycosylhydrolase [Butyrivibrio sp. WCE2006]|uniref:cellulase family glycosylhydrolase n=1 Tax=Butyrivibrio sp. WCE2006 TaxID=1410611 RepID=UPI000B2CFFCC|nr:cellulase family glycosylhydrolase [Butyrivibrio sp. WCE2006]
MSSFKNFITCEGTRLMDGDKELRFISLNYPQATSDNPWEQENAIKTIKAMGGKVTRTYVMPVYNSQNEKWAYVTGVDADDNLIFNEDALNALDNLLAVCNKHGIRVIIPFVDHWHWVGGMESYVWLAGLSEGDTPRRGTFYDWAWKFYSEEKPRHYFKQMIEHLLDRKNTVTGVKYKDDKAILCWETGNELGGNPKAQEDHDAELTEWTRDIAGFVKSLDENHLVLDGRMSTTTSSRKSDNPSDILGAHYYEGDFAQRCAEETDIVHCEAQKPYILGEFGTYVSAEPCNRVFEEAVKHNANGTMMWSLRAHKDGYGFYFHDEDGYWASYHWPGFPAGSYYGEREILRSVYAYAQIVNNNASNYDEAKNIPIPAPETDEAPLLYEESFKGSSVSDIKWRGVVGGAYYEIQRMEVVADENTDESSWVTIASENEKVYDSGRNWEDDRDCIAGFNDETAIDGRTYSYRLRACNESGKGLWSNIVTVKKVCHKLVDPLDLISVSIDDPNPTEIRRTYSSFHSLCIKCEDGKIFNCSDSEEGFIEYSSRIPIKSVNVELHGNPDKIRLCASEDGTNYEEIKDVLNVSDKKMYYNFRLFLAPGSNETVDSVTFLYENSGL